MKLFTYGTLQRGFGNNRLLADATFLGSAVSCKPYVLFNAGFPYAVPYTENEGTHPLLPITGEVFEVTEQQLERCDGLEGHPRWYKRTRIKVKMEGGEVEAYIYEMPTTPSCRLSTIINGIYSWAA